MNSEPRTSVKEFTKHRKQGICRKMLVECRITGVVDKMCKIYAGSGEDWYEGDRCKLGQFPCIR